MGVGCLWIGQRQGWVTGTWPVASFKFSLGKEKGAVLYAPPPRGLGLLDWLGGE